MQNYSFVSSYLLIHHIEHDVVMLLLKCRVYVYSFFKTNWLSSSSRASPCISTLIAYSLSLILLRVSCTCFIIENSDPQELYRKKTKIHIDKSTGPKNRVDCCLIGLCQIKLIHIKSNYSCSFFCTFLF